jgi:hypothetical protein
VRGAALRTINALHTGLLIDDRWWPPTCAAKRATDYLRNTIQLDYYRINTAAATNDNAADDRGGRKHDRSQTAAFARRHGAPLPTCLRDQPSEAERTTFARSTMPAKI